MGQCLAFLLLVGTLSSSLSLGETGALPRPSGPYTPSPPQGSGQPRSVTVEGNVLTTERSRSEEGPVMELRLSTQSGEVRVKLEPRWFRMERDLNFTKGEPLTVVGLSLSLGEAPTLLHAQKILRGDRRVLEPKGP